MFHKVIKNKLSLEYKIKQRQTKYRYFSIKAWSAHGHAALKKAIKIVILFSLPTMFPNFSF